MLDDVPSFPSPGEVDGAALSALAVAVGAISNYVALIRCVCADWQ
jgi:hypothetical protein